MAFWIGILRAVEFSPNSNDLNIMKKVAEKLQVANQKVSMISERDFMEKEITGDAYFSMARSESALRLLDEKERQGAAVFNSANGVRNCSRPVITNLMMQNQIPVPQSVILNLADSERDLPPLKYPCWLKRGDSCAQQKADVSFVQNEKEYGEAVEDFKKRRIFSAVLCEHLAGDVVKFYGVAETPFFYWYYPTLDGGHSKFGLEKINGRAQQFCFDVRALKKIADQVAYIADTPVYGGDCIVDASGNFKIIDFNDWPSFSSCVDEAAEAISSFLLKHYSDNGNNKK